MDKKYTEEQIKDITEREKKALEALRELQITPAAQLIKVNIGSKELPDVFADKIIPFLQDTKYFQENAVLDTTPATE